MPGSTSVTQVPVALGVNEGCSASFSRRCTAPSLPSMFGPSTVFSQLGSVAEV